MFDLSSDPFEEKDLAADKPEELAALKKGYEAWFADVTKKGFLPPNIVIGSEKENPVRLSRQDWRGPKAGWTPESIAETWLGALAWALGSQTCSGMMPALMPKPRSAVRKIALRNPVPPCPG